MPLHEMLVARAGTFSARQLANLASNTIADQDAIREVAQRARGLLLGHRASACQGHWWMTMLGDRAQALSGVNLGVGVIDRERWRRACSTTADAELDTGHGHDEL